MFIIILAAVLVLSTHAGAFTIAQGRRSVIFRKSSAQSSPALSDKSTSSLRCGLYMELPEWSSMPIISNTREAEGLRMIEIEAPEIGAEYSTPGQYLKVKKGDGKPGFFAIASPPDKRSVLQFLVKESEGSQFFTSAQIGDKLDLSAPQGKGFQIEEYFENYRNDWAVSNVVLLAAGSGLAPIASALEYPGLGLKQTGKNTLFERRATLYLGARSKAHLPMMSKYAAWKELGIDVIPVLSQPDADWTGRKGYVQDALKEDGIKVPRNSGVLMCGQRGMTEDCKEALLEAGVFEGRILMNF